MADLAPLVRRGYVVDGDPYATGRPDRVTVPMRAPDGRPVVAKPYPAGGSGRRTFAGMQNLWRSSFGRERTPAGLPRPIEYVDDDELLVTERVEGRPAVELEVIGPPLLVDAMGLLADLHGSDASPARRRRAGGVVRSLERKAAAVAAIDGGLGATFDRLVDTLRASRPTGSPLVPTHGDFSVRNVLVGADRTVLIDWDRFAVADPARDVAYIGAWSWAQALRRRDTPDWSVLDTCLTAYDRRCPGSRVGERIGFYVAAGLARIAHSLVVLWPEDAPLGHCLLDEAHRHAR